jgi:iron(III) transport system permease protein
MAVIALGRRRTVDLPLLLIGLGTVVAAAMLLPPAYLLLRVSGEGATVWETLATSNTIQTLVRTATLAGAVTGAAVALAVPLAWLTIRTDLPARRAWAVVLALPLAVPSYVGAFTLVAALGPRGIARDLLAPIGVEQLPDLYGFTGAWLVLTLFTFPYVLLPAQAALRGMDRALDEAARALGKGPWTRFLHITLPQLRPAIAAGGLLVALYTLSDFGAVSILRFDSLTRVIFIEYKSAFDRTAAATLALLLVALALVVVTLESRSRGRAQYYTRNGHAAPRPARLGWWRWPAFALCLLVALIALGVPVAVMAYWLARGVSAGEALDPVRTTGLHSLTASGLAALAATAAALPIAILAARRPGFVSGLLEKATYLGYGLPGITIALALVFFAANYATPLYQTLALLIFAYVVRFLPQAVGACRGAFLQINPRTEEAARALGKGPLTVFARVTVPQALPGISAGAALVFLTAMKELPATLLLSPIGFETLATQVWSATTEAFFARAALPALILVALSALPVLFLHARNGRGHD